MTTIAGKEPSATSEEDRRTLASIRQFLESKKGRLARLAGPTKEGIAIPASLHRVLIEAARHLAEGN